jgi:hypothetical protein
LRFWFGDFLFWGGSAFLQGVLAKSACKMWFFDGVFVVNCGINVVFKGTLFDAEKYATFFNFIFRATLPSPSTLPF